MHLTVLRKSIKYLRIRVLPDESVVISAPKRVSDKFIESFIAERKPRIEKALERVRKSKQALPVEEGELLLHGEGYKFHSDSSLKKTFIDHEKKTIETPLDLSIKTKQIHRYKTYAKEYLSEKIETLAKKHAFSYKKLYIRDQKTKRWTCSSKKNISLNRKLVKMPEEITQYIICHELAHLKEMNHSKRFRAVVESLYPDYKNAKLRIKKHWMSVQ